MITAASYVSDAVGVFIPFGLFEVSYLILADIPMAKATLRRFTSW